MYYTVAVPLGSHTRRKGSCPKVFTNERKKRRQQMESAAGVSAGNKAALTGTPARLLSGSLILYLLPAHTHTHTQIIIILFIMVGFISLFFRIEIFSFLIIWHLIYFEIDTTGRRNIIKNFLCLS